MGHVTDQNSSTTDLVQEVEEGISASLIPANNEPSRAAQLEANSGRCFYCPIPGGKGFILAAEEAGELLALEDADYREVVRPYLVGRDISHDPRQAPTRFIIDFGLRSLEEAMKYPRALEIVRERVKPSQDKTRRRAYGERWQRFSEPIPAMREALKPLSRYIAGTATSKRVFFCWCKPWTCPSNATNAFAFDSDYPFGVLCSSIHSTWAAAQSSTLEDRLRHTKSSVFDTFPSPSPSPGERAAISAAATNLLSVRSELCAEHEIGLTDLNNQVDEGAHRHLVLAQKELDAAVAAAYGWSLSVVNDSEETVRSLLDLNARITEGNVRYAPFE